MIEEENTTNRLWIEKEQTVQQQTEECLIGGKEEQRAEERLIEETWTERWRESGWSEKTEGRQVRRSVIW